MKYLPENLINNFLDNWSEKRKKYNFGWRYEENDKVKKGEQELIENNLTEDEITYVMELMDEGYESKDILKLLEIQSNTVSELLVDYKKQHIQYYIEEAKKEENSKNGATNNINPLMNENVYERYDHSKYYKDYGIIRLPYNDTIILNSQEKKIIEQDPSLLDEIINFYETFKSLNLLSIWQYRNELIDSFGHGTITFDGNITDDGNLIKIGNHLINFINNLNKENGNKLEVLNKQYSINGLKNELMKFSGANSIMSSKKTFNSYSEDRFASDLRELGIIGNGLGFQKNKFRKILTGQKI